MPQPHSLNQSNVEQLLASLRDNYLSEFHEHCDSLEEYAMKMIKEATFEDGFANIYRKVHSIKGSAGTHGLMALSTICHHFEDLLTLLDNGDRQCDEPVIDICMRYIDLLRETSWTLQSGDLDQTSLNVSLDDLRNAVFPCEYKGLIADASRFNLRFCADSLEGLPVTLATVDNGFTALERLINDEFDFFITSKELPALNGVAVLSALRTSETKNAAINAILMTSNLNIALPNENLVSHIVKKDQFMSDSLNSAVRKLLAKVPKKK
ncbi:Hpt domain-containing protein [Pseudomonadota bacterium]